MPWRQPSAGRETDKADTWFSLRYCPAYNEMLWKQTVQAVRMAEAEAMSSTLKLCMLCRPMLLDSYRGEVYPSYTLIEQGHWQSLY